MQKAIYMVLLTLSSCGLFNPQESALNNVSTTYKQLLKDLGTLTAQWAQYCGSTVSKDDCDTGDAALFGGLACSSGDETACTGVKLAQDTSGRWWRSEQQKGVCTSNCFSRDMMMGVLVYLVTKKDTAAAQSWMNYITSNNNKLCPDDTDGRCLLTPGSWGLIGLAWENLGLTKNTLMTTGEVLDEAGLDVSANTSPLGYQTHLVAVNLYFRRILNQNSTITVKAAATLTSRQPQNPFFRYLSESANDANSQLVLDKCPFTQPQYRTQWAWERDTEETAWVDSMGHDCLFLTRLFTR